MADTQAGTEFLKIKAQEPLFRITEVFLWDDAGIITSGNSTHNVYLSLETAASSSIQEIKKNSCITTNKESSADHTVTEYLCVEELELAQQLDTLGLPLSFGTSKARNNVTSRSKRNGTKPKSANHEKERNKPVPQIMVYSQRENTASLSLHGDSLPEEILEDACSRTLYHHDGDLLNKHGRCSDESSTSCCNLRLKSETQTLQRSFVSAEFPLQPFGDYHDNFVCCNGDWCVIWDPFYASNYFFNVQTLELTWYPPLGLEKYAFAWRNTCIKETREGAAEKNAAGKYSCGSISVVTDSLPENGGGFHFTDKQPDAEQPVEISAKMEAGVDFASHYTTIGNGDLNVQLSLYTSFVTDDMKDEEHECKDLDEQKEKQQGGMLGSYYEYECKMSTLNENGNAFSFPEAYTSSSDGMDSAYENVAINKENKEKVKELTWCHSVSLVKYWLQRYSLFSRFDNGIKMDEESWFSVTPEQIAKHHAFRCGAGTIIDCFSGVGGNAIQFAMRSNHVIAIDVDPQKIDYAQNNAIIYGVGGRINFIKGDIFKMAPSLKGDVVFLAPPWGGPNYVKMKTYDLRSLKPRDGYYLFKIASKIAPKVVMFLPRNVNLDQLEELSLLADPPWKLEVEKNYLNGKLKSITAYFDKATLN